jgi:hypothetical protein
VWQKFDNRVLGADMCVLTGARCLLSKNIVVYFRIVDEEFIYLITQLDTKRLCEIFANFSASSSCRYFRQFSHTREQPAADEIRKQFRKTPETRV